MSVGVTTDQKQRKKQTNCISQIFIKISYGLKRSKWMTLSIWLNI